MAQFRVHHVKQQRGTMHGGGVVANTGWWWWWGCALAKCEAGRGVGPKPETELLWLGLGRAVCNNNGGWCVRVARWHVPSGSGCGVMGSQNVRQGGGLGPKPETEPLWLG